MKNPTHKHLILAATISLGLILFVSFGLDGSFLKASFGASDANMRVQLSSEVMSQELNPWHEDSTLAAFDFQGKPDEDLIVTDLTFKVYRAFDDVALDNIFEYVSLEDGSGESVSSLVSADSSGFIHFTELDWLVPAGETKTLFVHANLFTDLPNGTRFYVDIPNISRNVVLENLAGERAYVNRKNRPNKNAEVPTRISINTETEVIFVQGDAPLSVMILGQEDVPVFHFSLESDEDFYLDRLGFAYKVLSSDEESDFDVDDMYYMNPFSDYMIDEFFDFNFQNFTLEYNNTAQVLAENIGRMAPHEFRGKTDTLEGTNFWVIMDSEGVVEHKFVEGLDRKLFPGGIVHDFTLHMDIRNDFHLLGEQITFNYAPLSFEYSIPLDGSQGITLPNVSVLGPILQVFTD